MTILPLPEVKKSRVQSTASKWTKKVRPAVMFHAFNPCTGEAEAMGFQRVPGQPGQTVRSCLKTKLKKEGQLNAYKPHSQWLTMLSMVRTSGTCRTEVGYDDLVSLPPTLQSGRLAATSDLETCPSVGFSVVTVCPGLLEVTVGALLHKGDVPCKYTPKGNEVTHHTERWALSWFHIQCSIIYNSQDPK